MKWKPIEEATDADRAHPNLMVYNAEMERPAPAYASRRMNRKGNVIEEWSWQNIWDYGNECRTIYTKSCQTYFLIVEKPDEELTT